MPGVERHAGKPAFGLTAECGSGRNVGCAFT